MRICKIYKRGVEEISWFDNTVKTKLLVKARTDTLDLNWRGRFKNRDTRCRSTCDYISEALEHFVLHCELYMDVRMRYEIIQQPYIENECELMSDNLCFRNCGKQNNRK